MVSDALLDLLSTIVGGLLGTLPPVPVPSWLASASSWAAEVAAMGAGLGVWVPAQLIMTVTGALLVAWLAGFAVKGFRIVASFLTFGGGSAA